MYESSRRRALPLAMAALSLAVAMVGCSSAGGPPAGGATGAATSDNTAAGSRVTGPLCDELPSGSDPGNPAALAHERADTALQWIPVLTKFEAAVRASGLAADLRTANGLTILAPTDDAFNAKFSEETFDELILVRKDDLRTLVKSHLVDRSLSLAGLAEAGTVTTLAGTSVKVARADGVTGIDRARAVCADYQVANGRIHVIDAVLGNLPTTASSDDHPSH